MMICKTIAAAPLRLRNDSESPRRNVQVSWLPVTRILRSSGVENAGQLIGNPQTEIVWKHPDPVRMVPGAELLLDFGRELSGGISIVCGLAAGRIRLTFGESVGEACGIPDQTHAIHRTELELPKLGTLEYGGTGFRFARIEALSELELINVLARSVEQPAESLGSFECDDDKLNEIWQVARRTVRLCMGNYIYDGAKRDRLVWMGDLYPEIRSIFAAFGPHPLIGESLDFLRDHTPSSAFMNDISSYSLWFVVCQYEYFMRSGDREYLREQHGCLAGLLRRFASFHDRNGAETLPGRRFLDWPSDDKPGTVHAGLQGLYLWAFRCGEVLAGFLEDDPLRRLCGETVTVCAAHRPPPEAGKTAAALQILGGVSAATETLERDPFRNISTFGGGFVLQALARSGKQALALELIRTYWGAMLDRGATTFWEDFDLGWLEESGRIDEFTPEGKRDLHADYGNFCYKGLRHSLCHGWSAAPCAHLPEEIAGIRYLAPGGPVEFTPRPCGLRFVRCRIPAGDALYSFEYEEGKAHRAVRIN